MNWSTAYQTNSFIVLHLLENKSNKVDITSDYFFDVQNYYYSLLMKAMSAVTRSLYFKQTVNKSEQGLHELLAHIIAHFCLLTLE